MNKMSMYYNNEEKTFLFSILGKFSVLFSDSSKFSLYIK